MANSNGSVANVKGRILWVLGDSLWKGAVKIDDKTKQPSINSKTGEQIVEYGFGLAVPKSTLTQDQMREGGEGEWLIKAQQEVMSIYPNGLPREFAWKWKDGDTDIHQDGSKYSDREGYAGCMVLSCVTRIPFKCFKHHNGAFMEIGEGINAGDYVVANLSIKAHTAEGNSKAGMYYNPNMVCLLGKGEPIVSAARNPESAFGMDAPQVASWMNIVQPQAAQAPAGFGNFAQQAAPPVAPGFPAGFGGAPAQQQAPAAEPYYGALPQAHQPQQAPVGNFGNMNPPMNQQVNVGFPQNTQAAPSTPSNGGGFPPGFPMMR